MSFERFNAFWKSAIENEIKEWNNETAKEVAYSCFAIGRVLEREKIIKQLRSPEAIKDIFS